ncbi:DUF1073 domain-containing protein [Glaesserella parasuis]|uniref:DUF1073 domain-containing protein n=1 Tax=Glaesserella parasuis TaxID=738 RepID=UPI00132C14FD|nr:anti-CBASS Acb1 family protein [Glaesserella parasuis]MDG6480949.1 DUF1073 domain-containing protein [Glaesserella parasuis]MWQ83364.1 DUF1073 domain-containing protein [Glaesserella parasuis]
MSLEQDRLAFLAEALGLGNTKRKKLWDEFGYPKNLVFSHFHKAYKRNSVAFAAIERLLNQCWIDVPVIVEGGKKDEVEKTSEWEALVERFLKRHWAAIKEADKRNLVGNYSALLIQVKDGQQWDQPILQNSLTKLGEFGLARLIPVWQSQLSVLDYQEDIAADNYGEPLMYQFSELAFGKKGRGRDIKVHASRVILLNEGGDFNSPESGVPLLEPGYNKLLDLEKTSGGSAEGFLKNASRQLGIKLTKDVDLRQLEEGAKALGFTSFSEALNDKIKKINTGTDSALVTQEGDASVLSVAPADPKPTWEISANEFAASVQIPFTILFGQQTGRLASDEDKADWANRCNARRNGFLSETIKQVLERLWFIGVLPMPKNGEITVSWSDLLAPSEKDKIANAQALTSVATTSQSAFGASVIVPNEIREALGFEPLPDNPLPPTIEQDDENQDENQTTKDSYK